MSERRPGLFFRMIVVVLFTLCLAQIASAQTARPPDDKEALQALLIEVRSLRQALQTLQRMSIDTYRTQLLVDRIRLSQEEVRRLTASLDETRERLSKTQSSVPHFLERHRLLETRAQAEVDQNKRAEFEFEARSTKEAAERYKAQIEPLKERETQLSAEINRAKARVEELENRLEFLERAIENDRQRLETDRPVQRVP